MTSGDLRVCIVGGVFDNPESRRRAHAPEVVLARGLRGLGVEVETSGHRGFRPSDAFDVVHVHHLGRAALAMAAAAGRSHYVFTSHDPKIVSGYAVSRRRMAAARFVNRRADALVALSEAERRAMTALFPRDAAKFGVIPNGFPDDVFSHRPSADGPKPPARPFRLLFVGQLIEQKGLDVLLRALGRLEAARVELDLVYHNPQLEGHYRDMVTRLGLADRVRFVGFRTGDDLADQYRRADVLVLPTFAEALPSVIIEAMMCGTPVVSTRIAGIPDQVGPYGHLTEPGDVAGLARAIDEALARVAAGTVEPEEISRYATGRFSVAAMVEAHHALYRGLIEADRPAERSRFLYRPVNAGTRMLLGSVGRSLVGKGLLTG